MRNDGKTLQCAKSSMNNDGVLGDDSRGATADLPLLTRILQIAASWNFDTASSVEILTSDFEIDI